MPRLEIVCKPYFTSYRNLTYLLKTLLVSLQFLLMNIEKMLRNVLKIT